jgi:hypothetical protein
MFSERELMISSKSNAESITCIFIERKGKKKKTREEKGIKSKPLQKDIIN